jgi:hypothetical protein
MSHRKATLVLTLMIGVPAVTAGCTSPDRSLGTGLTHDAGSDAGSPPTPDAGSDAGSPPTPDAGTDGLQLYFTCGDPVCRGYTGGSGAPLCTTELAGDTCSTNGQSCDPQNSCNALLICASSDPRMRTGGCPISRRRFKEDVHYLTPGELARYRDELLSMKLATWRYKHDPGKQRLGILIDDNQESVAVDAQRDVMDLYGYTSMAVATIQLQAQRIEALEREVAALKETRTLPARPASLSRGRGQSGSRP